MASLFVLTLFLFSCPCYMFCDIVENIGCIVVCGFCNLKLLLWNNIHLCCRFFCILFEYHILLHIVSSSLVVCLCDGIPCGCLSCMFWCTVGYHHLGYFLCISILYYIYILYSLIILYHCKYIFIYSVPNTYTVFNFMMLKKMDLFFTI